jgi:hypothetical protein
VFTVVEAVEAEHAFAGSDMTGGFAPTFAGFLAELAVDAFVLFLADPPDCVSTEDTEQGSERTDEATVEPWDGEVQEDGGEENCEDYPCSIVETVGDGDDVGGLVEDGDQNEIRRAGDEGYRVEQSDLEGAGYGGEGRHGKQEDEDEVFYALGSSVFVQFDLAGDFLQTAAQVAYEVVYCAEGTDEAAEESTEQDCEYYGRQGPEERPVESVRREDRAERDKWIELKDEIDGPGADLVKLLAHGADDAEPEEHDEEEKLAHASYVNDFHWLLSQLIVVVLGFKDS